MLMDRFLARHPMFRRLVAAMAATLTAGLDRSHHHRSTAARARSAGTDHLLTTTAPNDRDHCLPTTLRGNWSGGLIGVSV